MLNSIAMTIPSDIVKELLEKIIVEENYSPEEISNRAKISKATVYQILKNPKRNIQRSTVRRICDAFGYTFYYDGETFKLTKGKRYDAPSSRLPHIAEPPRVNYYKLIGRGINKPPLPIIPIDQVEVNGIRSEQLQNLPPEYEKALKSRKSWEGDSENWTVRPDDVTDITAYAIVVQDDSMLPLLKPGAIVITSPKEKCNYGDLSVTKIVDNSTYIRQVFFLENDFVQLKTFNQTSQDKIVQKDKLEFCHKIVWIRM